MTAIAVKICGVSDRAALDAAVESRADWVGFVLEPRSPRHLAPANAAALASSLPTAVRPVLLLVDPDDATLDAAHAAVEHAALQLYATPARLAAIRARLRPGDAPGPELWHAMPLVPGAVPPDATIADRLVIEAAPAAVGALPGGHGGILDPSALADWHAPVPWLLAGGLDPGNVASAIRRSGARAVDVSSGVERTRGHKDPALIRAFVAAARNDGVATASGAAAG